MKTLFVLLALTTQVALAARQNVIVRYNNSYNGDSDHFAQCLITEKGLVTVIGQGLQAADLNSFQASPSAFVELKKNLVVAQLGTEASYGGYDFLAFEYPEALMIGGISVGHQFEYRVVKSSSKLEKTIKRICRIEARD